MIYTLYLWTVVAVTTGGRLYQDWRPVGEFQSYISLSKDNGPTAKELCEKAAKDLDLLTDNRYRCVRTK